MKIVAALLSGLLALPAMAQEIPIAASSSSTNNMPPFVISAPGVHGEQVSRLKKMRAAGGITAAGGLTLMAYAVFAGTGPLGWAAALIFLGGMTAYLSHRKIHGQDDFSPGQTAQKAP